MTTINTTPQRQPSRIREIEWAITSTSSL